MVNTSSAIGIDIGGTKIAIGIVDQQGTILAQTAFPTDSPLGIPNACERIHQAISNLTDELNLSISKLAGIGIGCPGPMNRETGEILNPHTLPGWENVSLTQTLESRINLPIELENDADAALLGECYAGAAAGCQHVVMLTFGTGVGGAALTEGRILRGIDGEHPEIGLIPVLPDEATDYSGVPGSLESIASGTGIAKAGILLGFPDSPSVFTAAKSGDIKATEIIRKATRAITLGCLTLAHTLCPERIVLGGGLMDDHYDTFASRIQVAIDQATLLPPQRIKLAKATLGNLAGIVGAASLVLKSIARTTRH
ncbi:MAG: ROK family protein [Verrucomicrobia bacterium]|jgi:glucokinase|nr:ROK family protein [Verrucomicrobiota bacterium]